MNTLERSYWLNYKSQLSCKYTLYHERINHILNDPDIDTEKEKFKIMILNDLLRVAGLWGDIHVTRSVDMQSDALKQRLIEAVRHFDDFTEDNDPYGEHDFGKLIVDGSDYFFKIDYYNKDKTCGSGDPSNPAITSRVMTIMKAEDR